MEVQLSFISIGVESILRLSSEQLLRQKQILDLLMDMDKPLQDQELLNIADSIVLDPSKYIGVFLINSTFQLKFKNICFYIGN